MRKGKSIFFASLAILGMISQNLALTCYAIEKTMNVRQTSPFPKVPLSSWMTHYGQLFPEVATIPLKNLILPGTHDSATSTITASSKFAREQDPPHELNWLRYLGVGFIVSGIAAKWSKAQGKSLGEQLNLGIRYFDMRVVYRESDRSFYSVHGLYGDHLDTILKEVQDFLAKNPKEVILLDFNHLHNMQPAPKRDLNGRLIQKIKSYFGNKMASRKRFGPSSTLQDFWDAGKQVIVFYYNDKGDKKDNTRAQRDSLLWGSENITSPWPNKQTVEDLKKALERTMSAEARFQGDRFFVLQNILTPDGGIIGRGGLIGSPHNLKDLSEEPKKMLRENISLWRKRPDKKLNIVMMDYFEEPALIQQVIQQNLIP